MVDELSLACGQIPNSSPNLQGELHLWHNHALLRHHATCSHVLHMNEEEESSPIIKGYGGMYSTFTRRKEGITKTSKIALERSMLAFNDQEMPLWPKAQCSCRSSKGSSVFWPKITMAQSSGAAGERTMAGKTRESWQKSYPCSSAL